MESALTYLLKSGLAMMLFYIFYRLIVFQNTYYKMRRITLMGIILFSVIYPFVTLSAFWTPVGEIGAQQILRIDLPEVTIGNEGLAFRFTSVQVMLAVYLSVAGILMLRMLYALGAILNLRKKAVLREFRGTRIHVLPASEAPFSFFNLIFFNPDNKEEGEARQILLHELTHARQYHSVDMLLCELMTVVFWFNPFAWLLKQEVKVNLELLADEKVIRSGEAAKSYQYALLKLCHPVKINKLVNNFNVSQFKRRIIMMNKMRSSRFSLLRYMLFIPVSLLLIVACNGKESSKPDEAVQVEESYVVEQPAVEAVQPAEPEEVFVVVEDMPEYPGGTNELLKFIAKSIKYPAEATEKKEEGRVIVSFVVDKTGKVIDPEIIRGVSPSLDAEAVRVVESMPDWTPGKQKGVNVNVKYTLPVSFRLQ